MRWKQVDRTRAKFPTEGTYERWKPVIREHCHLQCAYCAIHESRFGGTRNFHVEHFRPKSQFVKLRDQVTNLLYACSVCNSFKGDDWPGEPMDDHSQVAYPDPALNDYNILFTVRPNHQIEGNYVASVYLVERLALNRCQLIEERRQSQLLAQIAKFRSTVEPLINSAISGDQLSPEVRKVLVRIHKALCAIEVLCSQLFDATPYNAEDLRRPVLA